MHLVHALSQDMLEAEISESLPSTLNGRITFGSFNNTSKLSASTLKLWGRVLQALLCGYTRHCVPAVMSWLCEMRCF